MYIKPETFDNRITKDNYENFFFITAKTFAGHPRVPESILRVLPCIHLLILYIQREKGR